MEVTVVTSVGQGVGRALRRVQVLCRASHHRDRADDDEESSSDFLPTTHKLEFPKMTILCPFASLTLEIHPSPMRLRCEM
jgi:hypothetical protein